MKILPNWYCTSQLLSFLCNYFLSYYYSMYLRLLYNSIFNDYCCYDYAINCAKHIGFEHESSSKALFGDIIAYNKEKLLNLDNCFINLDGLCKKNIFFLLYG